MNDRVRRVHCSNGFCKFDSYTTTKYINMNKVKMIQKEYSQSTSQLIARSKTKLSSENNSSKLVTDYDKESFDEWMKDLIDQNGVTKY